MPSTIHHQSTEGQRGLITIGLFDATARVLKDTGLSISESQSYTDIIKTKAMPIYEGRHHIYELKPSKFLAKLQQIKVMMAINRESIVTSHQLNTILYQVSWYFDAYCDASGFVAARKTFLGYLGPAN